MTAGLPSFETHIFIRLPGKGAIAPFNVPFFSADRQICFLQPAVFSLSGESCRCRTVSGKQHDAACLQIQPAYAVNFHLLSVLPKIIGKLIGQRILIMTMRRMYCHTGWFIHCDHIRIFIENVRHLFKGQQMCGAAAFCLQQNFQHIAF